MEAAMKMLGVPKSHLVECMFHTNKVHQRLVEIQVMKLELEKQATTNIIDLQKERFMRIMQQKSKNWLDTDEHVRLHFQREYFDALRHEERTDTNLTEKQRKKIELAKKKQKRRKRKSPVKGVRAGMPFAGGPAVGVPPASRPPQMTASTRAPPTSSSHTTVKLPALPLKASGSTTKKAHLTSVSAPAPMRTYPTFRANVSDSSEASPNIGSHPQDAEIDRIVDRFLKKAPSIFDEERTIRYDLRRQRQLRLEKIIETEVEKGHRVQQNALRDVRFQALQQSLFFKDED